MLRSGNWKLTSAAVISLLLALGSVFWLRPDLGKKGGDVSEGNGPRVTKPYPRERDARQRRTKNPREEFEAARKRGLTEEEVRGIVEEFVRAGIGDINLSSTTERELLANRKEENSWYLQTLVEGLGLTPDQQKVAAEKLHKSRVHNYSVFLTEKAEAAASIGVELVPDDAIFNTDPFTSDDADRVGTIRFLPWDLCELYEGQKQLLGLRIEGEKWTWPRAGSETLDFGTEKKYENLDDPFCEYQISVANAGHVFPLSMDQVDRILALKRSYGRSATRESQRGLPLLEEVKVLTTAQLRTLLFVQASVAERLTKELGE